MKKSLYLSILLLLTGLMLNAQDQMTAAITKVDAEKIEKKTDKTEKSEEAKAEVPAEEDEEGTKFTLSGSVDTYFRTNFNGPNDAEEFGVVAPATSFANLPGFSLGMINLVGTVTGEKAGVVADLVFGPRGSDAVFASPMYSNSGQIVNQLYAYWNMSDNVTLTLGNFNTFLGYEVISPSANFNYSTSYMFSYGPFSHTGMKIDVATESGFSFMAGLLNPTDITEFNPTGDYFFGAQIGYGGFYLNGLFGEDYSQVDLTGGLDVSDKVYLGVNATITDTGDDTGFSGAALYAQYAVSEAFKLGTRVEYFKDKATVFGELDEANAFDITLTGNYSVGNLTIIPELRVDTNSEDVFLDADGVANGSLASFVLAFVYSF
ncbi:MAG: outer membrane beta-barrel protein [Bacteroidota bacterium]